MTTAIERIVDELSNTPERLAAGKQGIYANVDCFSASCYYEMDLPMHLYTPMFAISRTSGWCAHMIEQYKPDALLILGDTFSGLSVMPAAQRGIKIFHMEAGLRAWDKRMPEQRNRILIDHMSSILLPFNTYHRENLLRENIHPSKIFLSGNPTFDPGRLKLAGEEGFSSLFYMENKAQGVLCFPA